MTVAGSVAFVGREAEVRALLEAARASARGRGEAVLLGADAGGGKTRLLREVRSRLGGGRTLLLEGGCSEFGGAPYEPFLEIFAALDLAARLTGPAGSERFYAIERALGEAGAHRAMIWFVEDVHWAEDATLQLLGFLAQRIARLRLLLVATYRTDELHRDHPVLPYLGKFSRYPAVRRMTLAPLEPPDIRRIVAAHPEMARETWRETIDDIVERSEGNPFYAEELTRNAIERVRSGSGDSLPLAIRSAIAERLRIVAPAHRAILARSAVLGPQFTVALAARICETPETLVRAALAEGCRLQILTEAASDPPLYRYRHSLTREAIYGELLADERRALHRRVAAALQRDEPERLADIAYHFWAARDAAHALGANRRSGEAAERLGAYRDAARNYERALEFATDDGERAELLARAAHCWGFAGDSDRASRYFARARELLDAAGKADEAAGLAAMLAAHAQVAGDGTRALELVEEARQRLPPERVSAATLRPAFMSAWLLAFYGEVDAARAWIAPLHAMLAPGDARNRSNEQYVLALCAALEGNAESARRHAFAHLELVAGLGDSAAALVAPLNAAGLVQLAGLDEEAIALFERALRSLEGRDLHWFREVAQASLTATFVRRGDLERARSAFATLQPVNPGELTHVSVAKAIAALALGAAGGEAHRTREFVPSDLPRRVLASKDVIAIGTFGGLYARCLSSGGRRSEAREVLAQTLDAVALAAPLHETFLAIADSGDRMLADRAAALLRRADPGEATPLLAADAALFENARDAAARYRALGRAYQAARADEIAGDLGAALAAYRRHGALGDVRRLGGMATEDGEQRAGVLSQREREIARDVAAGLSNRDIAARRFVSQKTVEKHITAIYQKLGLSKRAELVRYVAESQRRSVARCR